MITTSNIISVFFLLGEWGPVLLIGISLLLLIKNNYNTYIFYFILGILFDVILNVFLKAIMKQPRPNTQSDLKRLLEKEGIPFCYEYGLTTESFGMPSGHSQAVAYNLIFLYLVLPFHRVPWIMYVLSIIILLNRLYFQFHYPSQVIVGLFIGCCTGYFFYFLAKRKLMGSLHKKTDDFYFF